MIKSNQPRISVIIPVYNEKNTILEIIKKIKDCEINIFFHERNYGKGHALRTGIEHAKGKIVVIQDADLEYDPKDYIKLIQPIEEGKTKVVYGTRFPKDKKGPSIFKNKFFLANKILTFTSNLLYDAKITDEPTCYKIFDIDVLKSLNLKCEKFEFCPEVTAKVRKKGHEIVELPIAYYPRTIEEGKKINWKDGFQALWTLVKYRFVD